MEIIKMENEKKQYWLLTLKEEEPSENEKVNHNRLLPLLLRQLDIAEELGTTDAFYYW